MVCSVFIPFAENSQAKHFLSALHTTVFTATFSGSYLNKDFRWVSLSNPTIFLRFCFPILPTLFQAPPVYSRHSLFGCKSTGFLCRLYTSVTAHRSIAQFQVFTALCTCLFHHFSSLFSAISFENFGLLKRVLSHSFPIFYRI